MATQHIVVPPPVERNTGTHIPGAIHVDATEAINLAVGKPHMVIVVWRDDDGTLYLDRFCRDFPYEDMPEATRMLRDNLAAEAPHLFPFE
jgi:hypothetical protein